MAERIIVRATFSLDKDVWNALVSTAKAQKRNKSSMVNYLLSLALAGGQDNRPPEDIPDRTGDEE